MSVRQDPNFAFMLVGILSLLIFGPIADSIFGEARSLVLMCAYSGMLVLGIWSLQESRMLFYSGITLAIVIFVLTVLNGLLKSDMIALAGLTVLLAFQLISLYLTVEYLLSAGRISANRLMGGVCSFMLIGMIFAGLYVYVHALDPLAFSGIQPDEQAQLYWDLIYYSFVTLTTLGYGDILPESQIARALAHLEATTGTLFVAILIGLLVGSYFREEESIRP